MAGATESARCGDMKALAATRHERQAFASHRHGKMHYMDLTALRVQASQEWADLGPEPADPLERETRAMEPDAAVMLLAELADRTPRYSATRRTASEYRPLRATCCSTRRRNAEGRAGHAKRGLKELVL